jgi:2-methylcitrate dehydratase PrpD
MRCIDHPTMVKDGSGWGAMAGVSAAYLAADGFTGGPAVTVEGEATADLWADLGDRWRILEQYFKPYPVCRWAQPAIEAALTLQRTHRVAADDIRCVRVSTFHEATRLATRQPSSTEEAQYSLPYPVAAALVRGRLGVGEVTAPAFDDLDILRLSAGMELHEADEYNLRFPGERWAHVTFLMKDGSEIQSKPEVARGNPESPLSDAELTDKFRGLAVPTLGVARSVAIEEAVRGLTGDTPDLRHLLAEVLAPAGSDRGGER